MIKNIVKLYMASLAIYSMAMAMDTDLIGPDKAKVSRSRSASQPKKIPRGDPSHQVFPYKETEYTREEVLEGLQPLFKSDEIRALFGIVFGVIFDIEGPPAHRGDKFTDALQRLHGKLKQYDLDEQREVLACLSRRHGITDDKLAWVSDQTLKAKLLGIINRQQIIAAK